MRPEPKYSLAPVARRLGELLGSEVALAGDVAGEQARACVDGLADGQVALLENVRFDARETSKDDAERAALAGEMAALAGDDGAYVGDAFGAVHRKHASVLVSELESAGQTLQLALAELPDGRLEAPLPTALHDALVLLDGAARQVASDVRDQARALGRDRSSEAAGGLAVARTAVADLVDALDRMTSDSVAQGRDVAWIERPRMGIISRSWRHLSPSVRRWTRARTGKTRF